MESIFKLGILFSVVDRVSAPARAAGGSVDSLRGKVAALAPQFEKFQTYGKQAAMFGMLLTALFAGPVYSASQFEASMSQVGAVSQATQEQMAALESSALSLGSSTIFSASQVASGQKYLAMSGMDANAIIASMPGVLNLASAANEDLGTTANIATNILSAFNLEAAKMGRVGDILTRTFTSSNTTLNSLAATMANAAPVANAAGVQIHELAAMAGKLGDIGIDASVSGTALKIMIQRLQAPTGNAVKSLEALGIATKDANGNMLPLFSILGQIEQATSAMGSSTRAAYMKEIFGEEAISSVTALLQMGIGTVSEYAQTLQTGPVTSAKVASQQMDNMQGAVTTLRSAIEGLSIVLGTQLLPILIPLLLMFASGIQHVTRFANSHKTLTKILIIGVGAVGMLALLLGSLAASFSALALIAPGFSAALLVAFPIVASIGLAALAASTDLLSLIFRFKEVSVAMLSFAYVAGKELLNKMATGVIAAGRMLIATVYAVFLDVRAMLPSSDARRGPLSRLTLAGRKIILTLVEGIKSVSPVIVAKIQAILHRIKISFMRFNAILASVPMLNWLVSHMGTIGGLLGKLSGGFNRTGISAARTTGALSRFGGMLSWLLGPMKLVIAAASLMYYVWSNNIFEIQQRLDGLISKVKSIDFSSLLAGNVSIALPDGLEKFYNSIKTFFYGMSVELSRLGRILNALLGPVIAWLSDSFIRLFALFSGDGQSSMEGLGRVIVILLGLPLEALAVVIRAVQMPISLLVDAVLALATAVKNIENPILQWVIVLGIVGAATKTLVAYTSLASLKTIAFSTATGVLKASQALLYPYSFLLARGLRLFTKEATISGVQTQILNTIQRAWAATLTFLNTHVKQLIVGMLVFVDSINFAAIRTKALAVAQYVWASSSAMVTAANGTMAASFTALTTAMSSNPIGAIVIGLVAAAGLLLRYWQEISQFFASLNLFESGRKIVSTLTQGILSAAKEPYEAILKIFTKMRELLPFSDAKVGPFSRLTLSGKRIISTLADGIRGQAHSLSYRMRLAGINAMDTFIYSIRTGRYGVLSAFGRMIPTGASKGSGIFVGLLKTTLFFAKRFVAILSGPVGWVLTTISLIHSAFHWNIFGIRSAWNALWGGIGQGMAMAWNEIKAVFGPLVAAFKEAFAPIGQLFAYIKNLLFGVGSEFNWLRAVGQSVGYAIIIPLKAVALVVRGLLYPFELLFKAIAKVNQFISGLNLFESGRKMITSFVSGIKSAILSPVESVKKAFSYVRNLMPFSDAKEGPLSQLTLSGSRVMTTLSAGVQIGAPRLHDEVSNALNAVDIPSLNIPFTADFPEAKPITSGNDSVMTFKEFFKEPDTQKPTINNNFYVDSIHIESVSDLDNMMLQLEQRLVVSHDAV